MALGIHPIQQKSIAEEVAERLRSLILRGELVPGERLPAERELALRFGTNRNTLREALRTLEAQGLLAVRQGAPSEVLDFRRSANILVIPFFFRELGLDPELVPIVRDLYILRREFMEAMAARAAAAGNAERRAVERAADAVLAARGDTRMVLRRDVEFHRAVTEATGSIACLWLLNTFAPIFEFIATSAPAGWAFPESYFAGIAHIARAIAAGRPRVASRAMRRHLLAMDELALRFLARVTRRRRRNG